MNQKIKEVDLVDFFTLSQNEETTSCDFCNLSLKCDFKELDKHMVENHRDKFEKIIKRITCSKCKDQFDLAWNEKVIQEECANCDMEKTTWNEEFVFYGKCEWLSEWYDEKIINIYTGHQDKGMLRFLEVTKDDKTFKKVLFKLYHSIDYSYLGQSKSRLEYWNGNEFTNVTSLRVQDFVHDGVFNHKGFEAQVHEIIEMFKRYI